MTVLAWALCATQALVLAFIAGVFAERRRITKVQRAAWERIEAQLEANQAPRARRKLDA